MSADSESPAAKLVTVIRPIFQDIVREVKDQNVALSEKILISLGRVETNLNVIVKLLEDGAGKPKARTKKAEAAPDVAAAPAGNNAEVANVVAGAIPPPKLSNNAYNQFTNEWKTDAKFRAELLKRADMVAQFATDEAIMKKKTPEEQINPQGKNAWNWLKKNDEKWHAEYVAEYEKMKAKQAEANKPAPQVKETVTPPEPAK